MNTTSTDQATQIYGYDVIDNAGNKLGTVDGVWVDDATNALEFAGIKTGWLFGKTHIIPLQSANIDNGNSAITVPYDGDQVKNAPSFDTDAELSPDDEDSIYSYYGLQRETADSPSGLADNTTTGYDTTTTGYNTTTTDYDTTNAATGSTGFVATAGDGTDLPTPPEDVAVTLSEENLAVGKRTVEAGRVRLRKVVHTDTVEQPVELRREEIEIERIDADGATVPDDAFQNQEIEIPVMREEAVVGKETRVTGQVHVSKDVESVTQNVGGQVRSEDVEIDRTSLGDDYVDDGTNVVSQTTTGTTTVDTDPD
jgi:uncharacterized protein (TIGR02271 family)